MSAYEQVEEFEPVPEDKEGKFLSSRPVEGMPETADERLDFTQSIRSMIVNAVIQNGQVPVENKDLMGILKDAIDGIDRQELGKKKIDAKKDEAANVNAVAKLLESVSMQLSRDSGGNPMQQVLAAKPARNERDFDRDLTNAFNDIDESELAENRNEENSEEFFKRMKEQNEELRK